MASMIKIIPAFIFLITITNEYSFKTLRQNIIDGMNRRELLLGKLLLATGFSIVSLLFIFLSGLVIGGVFSPVNDFNSIFLHSDFLIGHFIEMLAYLSFALFLGILVRRTGFALVLLFIYSLIIEPILSAWIGYKFNGPEMFLPIKSIKLLVPNPFSKYLLIETQEHLKMISVFIAVCWGVIFNFGSYWLLRKRDLL